MEYASLGSIFYNPVIYEDELYLIPQGKTNVKDEKKVLKIELKSGNQKIYEINQLAMNSICVNDKNELKKLKGTKYIQSYIGNSYLKIKGQLKEGKSSRK